MSTHQEPEPKNQSHSSPKPVDGAFSQPPAFADSAHAQTETTHQTSKLQTPIAKSDRLDDNFEQIDTYADTPGVSQPKLLEQPLEGVIQREADTEEGTEAEVQTKPLNSVIQREADTEEETEAEVQTKPLNSVIQREADTEEETEAEVQTKPLNSVIQREADTEEATESEVQTKPLNSVIQREADTEEATESEVQTKPLNNVIQREADTEEETEPEVQTKVVIGSPGDKYEQEADRVADAVMSMDVPSAPQTIQRQTEEEEQPIQKSPIAASITPLIQRQTESEESIQTKPAGQKADSNSSLAASSSLSDRLSSQKGGGSALDEQVRSFMEPRFGNDFSSVRIHTGSEAVQMNKELKAQAFAHGSDIYFNQGKYNPKSDEGKRLLAHELTHVVQQTGAKKLQPKSLISLKSNKETPQAKISPVSDTAIQLKEAPKSAQSDPGFQAVVNKTKGIAKEQKSHPPAKTKSTEAQAAAKSPPNEIESKAQDKQVQEMNQQQPGKFNAGAFKAALMQKIAAVTPNTLEEVDKFKQNNKIDSVKGEVSSKVKEEKKQAANPIESKTKQPPNTSGIPPKPVTPLPPKQTATKPGDVGATEAAPKPKDASEVSLEAGSKSLDEQMSSANVTEEQLTKSNEPEFKSAVEAKKTAQKDAATAPQAYRQQEQGTLTQAQAEAKTTAQTQLEGMHGSKEQILAQVVGKQGETKGQDEQKRSEVANHIQGIYNTTKQKVEASLSQLDVEVNKEFDSGAAAAKTQFENYVEGRMQRYKDERYSGLGKLKWVKDKLFGMPSEVNAFYQEGKQQYLASMDKAMDKVANLVSTKLDAAKAEISKGRQEIQKYVAGLDPSLRQVGQEAAQNIQGKFDELEQSVDNKQDDLLDSLAQKYNENLHQIDARIDEMKAENRGWVDKAKDAIAGTIKTILELKNLLLGVLAKAAGAIDKIIKDPIGFLSNLVSGIKQGFMNFAGNIWEHLKKGLLGWLTGAIAGAGITMPETFDLKGIFSLVMQVLGLVYDAIKPRVIKALGKNGERLFNALEKGFEIFVVWKNEGIAGLWQFIQDKIGDLKAMVLDNIQNFVVESIIKAGVTWVISLLNPASAFVKACKAIYDIIMFFIERGSQIAELVNAVMDSIGAIASGAIGGAATLIENALSKALPVVISFMASLLGLGGISEKIQEIIMKVRQPIEKAIGWIVGKATKYGKALDNKFKVTKLGKKVESAKKSAIKKKEATEQWANKKKEAAQKHIEQKKQAIEKAIEQKKNKLADTKLGKKLVAADDWANKKLASLDEKREAFNNKLEAAKQLPSKKLAALEEKAEALKGAAKNKFKNSKIGQKLNNKWETTKDWAGKKKNALKDNKKNKSNGETNGKPDDRQMEQKKTDLKNALAEANVLLKNEKLTASDVSKRLPKIKSKYKMTALALIVDRKDGIKETVHVQGKINPEDRTGEAEKDDFDDKSPQELMKAAGNNWKEVKKKYLSHETVMKRLVAYRTQEVAAIVAAVKQALGDKKFKEVAAGSTDLTSDYDVTFDAGEHREVEIQAVKKFNQLFRQKWGMESGTVFDTNVYTTGHMPAGVGDLAIGELKALEEQLKNAPQGKRKELISEIAKKKRKIRSDARQLQKDAQSQTKEQLAKGSEKKSVEIMDVMSLVKIRRFMSDAEWKVYQQDTLKRFDDNTEKAAKEETRSRLKKADTLYKQAKKKLDSTILDIAQQVRTIDKGFNQQVKEIKERSQAYHQQVDEIKKRNRDAEMEANNRLYEKHLDQVEKILNKIKQLKEAGETTPEAKQKLDELTLKLQYMRSMALIYANEAYHTGGAVEDVVLNQQLNLKLPLATKRYLESINEQTGFIVEQTGHGDYPGMGLWKSAKYVERLCNAANQIKLESYTPPSSTARLLNMAQELQNIKKAKGDYKDAKTDEQKSAAALQLAQKHGYGSESALRAAVLNLNQEVNKQVRSLMSSMYTKQKK